MSSPVVHDSEARVSNTASTASARLGAGRGDLTGGRGKVYAAERALVRHMLRALGSPAVSLVLWNGQEIAAAAAAPVARVTVRDRTTLWRLLADPELHFGDAYAAGRIEVQGDLFEMLSTIYRAKEAARQTAGPLRRALARWLRRAGSNTLAGARQNIHRHYDLGNEFYELWLDREMVYSGAYFPEGTTSLDAAQLAKLDYVCRKLDLRPGETVVDIGGGWGALALHMARHYGVEVKAFNISHAQIVYARRRAREEQLDGRVEFIEDDYRNIAGRFDAVVSIGMLEHVGRDHYGEFGRTLDRCLSPTGRGLIQSIGQNRPGACSPWITRRIFPGGYVPSLREMLGFLEPWRFSVLDVENLRLHYAETLRHWSARFEAAAADVARMFDERFVRTWRLYLAGSRAAFATGALQLFQVVFARPAVADLPWTRTRLYARR